MKNCLKPLFVACTAILLFTACTKEAKEATADYVSDEAISKIQSLGFGTQGVKKIPSGYLVEGDIILSEAEINSNTSTASLLIAQEEQYRTFNLVSATKHPVINVALSLTNTAYSAAFGAALDEAIRRYNAENLQIRFQRVTSGAKITVVGFYENSNTLGSAGFPNSAGDPYSEVRMNTYHYSTGTGTTNVNYIATIMAHEIGHCIGFRHTDYMNRRYSCGFSFPNNEGQATSGVGAVHIPGTPTSGDPNSFMLACIGTNVNRPFNANDKIALSYLW